MDKILCYCCNKTKNKLNAKKSLLMPINLLMCETCISSKLEPRWVIILAGRQYGIDHVKDFVVKHKYVGNEITASELII
jgi:hypothetical protein